MGNTTRPLRVIQWATGAIGKKIKVRLTCEDAVVEETELDISSDDWQREVRLAHEPKTNGVVRYEVKADLLDGELFKDKLPGAHLALNLRHCRREFCVELVALFCKSRKFFLSLFV